MLKSIAIIFTLTLSKLVFASEEPLDIAFLEWLGETAEVEELGVDIGKLLQIQEDSAPKSEENSQ